MATRSSILSLCLALAGCNIVQFTANSTAKVLQVASPGLAMESDPELARAAAPASLKTVEGFYLASPKNKTLITILAKGYCEYAFGFVQSDWEELMLAGKEDEAKPIGNRATGLYLRCMNYGLKLLGKDWEKALYGDLETFEAKVKKAGKGNVPGMAFVAVGLASAVNLNRDDIAMAVYLPKARLLFERVAALDDKFPYATSANLGLGMMKTALPEALGGRPEEGRKHFETVIKITEGKFLMPKVLMAATYGVNTNNRKFFHDTLVEVLRTSPAIWPEQRLANELAHIRAKRWLAHEKELFR